MYKKNESGQAIVILAVVMVVLLVAAALAIDAGNAYTEKREAQNAADAAAMAGARQLVVECAKQDLVLNDPVYAGPGAVSANILNQVTQMAGVNAQDATVTAYYIGANGARMGQVQPPVPCTCATGAKGVEVVVQSSTSSFLAGLMGKPTLNVEATAKARYGQIAQVSSGLYPVTRRMPTDADPFVLGKQIEIRDERATGNFGWLTWAGSPSAPVLKNSMTPPGDSETYVNPYDANDHTINLGDWIEGSTGNMHSLASILDQYWVNTDRVMVIPLFDATEERGAKFNYRAAGFGAMKITGYSLGGNNKHIDAQFVRWVASGEWAQNVTCSEQSGLYSVQLAP